MIQPNDDLPDPTWRNNKKHKVPVSMTSPENNHYSLHILEAVYDEDKDETFRTQGLINGEYWFFAAINGRKKFVITCISPEPCLRQEFIDKYANDHSRWMEYSQEVELTGDADTDVQQCAKVISLVLQQTNHGIPPL